MNNLRLHAALSYGQDLILHRKDLKVASLLLFFKYTQILTFEWIERSIIFPLTFFLVNKVSKINCQDTHFKIRSRSMQGAASVANGPAHGALENPESEWDPHGVWGGCGADQATLVVPHIRARHFPLNLPLMSTWEKKNTQLITQPLSHLKKIGRASCRERV